MRLMEDVLFLAHVEEGGAVSSAALEALSVARQLAEGGKLTVGLIGGETGKAAAAIGGCGATRWLAVEGEAFTQARYGSDVVAAEAICRAAGAAIVVVAASSRWNRVLPGLAHRLGGRADTHVTGIAREGDAIRIHRWYYRQRLEGCLTRAQRPWCLAIESGVAPAWQGEAGAPGVEKVAADAGAVRAKVAGVQAPSEDAQTIRPDAKLLFVTGAGWTKKQGDGQVHAKDAEAIIRDFLRQTRASLGSTKSLVDLGGEGQAVLPFLTHLNQVGQTGSTPRHPKGLATCCHGEEPHTVGWRFIAERRAVNLDPNCGWARGKADVLYVADAFAVMGAVNAKLGGG